MSSRRSSALGLRSGGDYRHAHQHRAAAAPPNSSSSNNNNNSSSNNNMNAASGMLDGLGSGSHHGSRTNLEQEVEDAELVELERRLNEEVDEDLFQEPKVFHTLHRVIDVLGLQMIDDATVQSSAQDVHRNPAYLALKDQQRIVEGAIEHMAVIHCADLNGSVIQVGKVARQFNDAVNKVRQLRKQVRDIQDTLGAASVVNVKPTSSSKSSKNKNSKKGASKTDNTNNNNSKARSHNAAAMSLRELWLKKLECEATLALLDRLDIIRAAPAQFDMLLQPPCRIGAAVLTLSRALATMFADDVAQVQALHKIMEQLMLRKQRAEEILWETLNDVVFLRIGNGLAQPLLLASSTNAKGGAQDSADAAAGPSAASAAGGSHHHGATLLASSGQSVSSESGSVVKRRYVASGSSVAAGAGGGARVWTEKDHYRKNLRSATQAAGVTRALGMVNPFDGKHLRFAVDEDLDDAYNNNNKDNDDNNSVGSAASLFSLEEWNAEAAAAAADDNKSVAGDKDNKDSNQSIVASSHGGASTSKTKKKMMIPIPLLEAEIDLEADERRCLEEIALSGLSMQNNNNRRTAWDGFGPKPSSRQRQLPRYADPVLALRILVECLAQVKRIDDVERILQESLEREIRRLVQREQARTFLRMEKKRVPQSIRSVSKSESLKDFRRHLTGMLSAFGCVMLRLAHLAEILRLRITSDRDLMQKIESPSTVMCSVLASALDIMQREIKEFLKACLYPSDTPRLDPLEMSMRKGSTAYETGLFSLGIVDSSGVSGISGISALPVSTATRGNVMDMSVSKFVSTILFSKTRSNPEVRHALAFRRSIARWTSEIDAMRKELATLTGEDTSAASYKTSNEESALSFLDTLIQNDLLPVLQEEAVNGTVTGLERRDAFDPVLDRKLYARPNSNEPQFVDMCKACQIVYECTTPLFMALHRLPRGGQMYLPLVAVLEHVMLTFLSRVKQQVGNICNTKTGLNLLMQEGRGDESLATIFERRQPFTLLLRAYADGESMDKNPGGADELTKQTGLVPLAPSTSDTAPHQSVDLQSNAPVEDLADGVEGEEMILAKELAFLQPFMDFVALSEKTESIVVCSDEELIKAACLSHSLLKLASLLESRLKVRGRTLTATRALREAIKSIKLNGIKMAKFCRLDMLMQTILRMSKVCSSSTLVARDAVRIPSSVNDLGEYLTGASDNLREAAGNAVAAYTFSSLEQYIPLCLMQTVRVIAAGNGVVTKSPLTMNGIEALDRSGSVLYRDLKGATGFDNSFWDVELAAISFERSASFMAMMELGMEELVGYYTTNHEEFSEADFELMFSMTGPRRRGDINRFHLAKRQLNQ